MKRVPFVCGLYFARSIKQENGVEAYADHAVICLKYNRKMTENPVFD